MAAIANLLQPLYWFLARAQRLVAMGGDNVIAAGGGNVINGNGSTMSLAATASKVAEISIRSGYAVSSANPGITLGKGNSSMLSRRR